MTTSLQQQLPLLHQRPLPCRSSYQSCTGDHLPASADTNSHQPSTGDLPAAAIASPAPATTFLHQQTLASTFLHQQIPAATSSATATTSPEPATTSLHQQIPATTSPRPANTFLHRQIPVLHQRPPIQRIPVSYQLSKPDPTITIRPRRLFAVRFFDLRFAIIKFGLSKNTLVLSFLPSSLSITYISKVCGDRYIYLASATK